MATSSLDAKMNLAGKARDTWRRLTGKPGKERILHGYGCIFVHIPKTGGNSIMASLNSLPQRRAAAEFPPVKYPKHAKAAEVKGVVGDPLWEEYFSFAFVRNPWDLMVSSYGWWLQKAQKWEKFHLNVREIERMGSFSAFMHSRYGRRMINRSEGDIFDWISEDGRIIVDFVGRFESLQEDWDRICDRIGAPRRQLPHMNRTERKASYREYYSEETRRIVAERFHRTIEMFGYEF